MLIGIDASRAFRAARTGTERYAIEIIRHLLALPAASHHGWRLYSDRRCGADFFALPASAAYAPRPEIRVLPSRHLWTHLALARELRRQPPGVLFVPAHVLPWTWPVRRLPPCVVTVHDLGYHYFPDSHPARQRFYLSAGTRWSVKAADRVIAVSHATAADLIRLYAVPPEKIRVVHEATTPLAQPSPDEVAAVRHRYHLARPYGLYVGTIQPRKNLERLIRAYARLAAAGDLGWDLVLAGKPGWLSNALFTLAHDLHIDDRVHYLGYVQDDLLPALMRGATFFSFPSLFEGFGLPLLEAQQLGVPVMTANSSALPEVAGNAALYVDPTDVDAIAGALLRLSQDEALRQQLIEAGYRNVERFSWERAAQETLAVLEEAALSRG